MSNYFVLDKDRNVIPVDDVLTWVDFYNTHDRIVAQDNIGDVKVSTVFLGLDHGYGFLTGEVEPPIVFETMIFGGKHDLYQNRCATWTEAEAMHAKALAMVKS